MGWNKWWFAYSTGSQIKFKTLMLKSSTCDYSDAYILASGTISVENTAPQGANNNNKKLVIEIMPHLLIA